MQLIVILTLAATETIYIKYYDLSQKKKVWTPLQYSGGGEIFRTRPDRTWGPPNRLYNGFSASFPGVKRPGSGVNHPHPPSAEVKERVELYIYSPSGPSWCVLGRTLPLPVKFNGS